MLAEVDGHPVAVRQGNVLAVAFHPELTGETRLHELMLGARAATDVRASRRGRAAARAVALGVRGSRARTHPSPAAASHPARAGAAHRTGSSPSRGLIGVPWPRDSQAAKRADGDPGAAATRPASAP